MKIAITVYFFLFLLISYTAFSQPVIQNGNNLPSAGFNTQVSVGSAPNGPGASGANQVWDFSSVSLTQAATLTVVDPASTPYYSNYSSSNYSFMITVSSSPAVYDYLINSSSSFQTLAENITSNTGSGKNFSPDPLTTIKYPMHFGDSFSDTYQEVGQSANSVNVTYDGYGTLKLPDETFSNVVRIKMTYSDGSDYTWYSINPLFPLLVYNFSSNALTEFHSTTTGINGQNQAGIQSFKLNQNYPNPFNPSTTISYQIPKDSFVTLKVYDVLGREVSKLVNEKQSPGNYSVNFNASKLSSGIYLYKIHAGNFIQSKKLMLLK